MKYLLVIVFGFFLVGCEQAPSESKIVDLFIKEASKEINFATLDNVRKVNGFEESKNKYIADIKYDITFQHDFEVVAKQLTEQGGLFSGLKAIAISQMYGKFKKGDVQSHSVKLALNKTDNGWVVDK